jgi:hypothetical protein
MQGHSSPEKKKYRYYSGDTHFPLLPKVSHNAGSFFQSREVQQHSARK